MALVVEDGTGKLDANAYISVAAADAYFEARGNAKWAAATDPQKEAAIIDATAYIDLRWAGKIQGRGPVQPDQALMFPVIGLCDRCLRGQLMPPTLLQATAEYAVRALAGPLAPDPVVDPTGQALSVRRRKIGPIENEWQYQVNTGRGSGQSYWRSYPGADTLMGCMILRGLGPAQRAVIRG